MDDSDSEILRLVTQGDSAAFEIIVERYRPRLLRFAGQMLGDPSVADDLVQETFSAIFAARDSYNADFAFSTWVWTILLNLCRRERRRRSRSAQYWAALVDRRQAHPLHADDATVAVERQEEAVRLRALLEQLPAPQSDALQLRFFAELSFEEIAVTMNSSVSGAKARVRKGLAALAAQLRRTESNEFSVIKFGSHDHDL